MALTTVLARHGLVPAITYAKDAGARTGFKQLNGRSVAITPAQIAAAADVIVRLPEV